MVKSSIYSTFCSNLTNSKLFFVFSFYLHNFRLSTNETSSSSSFASCYFTSPAGQVRCLASFIQNRRKRNRNKAEVNKPKSKIKKCKVVTGGGNYFFASILFFPFSFSWFPLFYSTVKPLYFFQHTREKLTRNSKVGSLNLLRALRIYSTGDQH